jgi:hypothetical protein
MTGLKSIDQKITSATVSYRINLDLIKCYLTLKRVFAALWQVDVRTVIYKGRDHSNSPMSLGTAILIR